LLEAPRAGAVEIDAAFRARVESLLSRRGEARRQRNFSEADRLRAELQQMGVLLEDTPHGTTWKLSS
jgi:cysteinyl-tRNA synthetase